MDVKHGILLLEDETEASEMLANYLEMHSFEVFTAYNGNEALAIIEQHPDRISLAILDIMVPGTTGLDVCRSIRKNPIISEIPIIFLTAKDQERDEILGLESGADDYISKPASLKLIEARVKTLLRRQPARSTGWLHFGPIYLDIHNRVALADDKRLDLTHTEFRILELLLNQSNKVFTRQEILEHISDDQKFVFDRTVDVHVKNLRIKLGKAGDAIKTYRGTGYGMNRDQL
ncbi:MAG: response regulator transcription factor [Balneolales bacterium]|nr:response regulator transcription factor [Balneolales bacterium]